MKTLFLFSLLVSASVVTMAGCSTEEDNRAIPGTVESTDTKNSENNTPRTNPTPNPEPASNPPGPASDEHPVGTMPPQ